MTEPKIEPHKITKPFQLLAVLLAAMIILVSTFIAGARVVTTPPWLSATLGVSAVAVVPFFVVLIFLMLTRFRTHLQEDPYYERWLEREKKEFKDFVPENILPIPEPSEQMATGEESSVGDLEQRRITKYQTSRGLFLVHTWRLSQSQGQVADITIRLHQHGEGPLSEGLVKNVEYELGRKFFERPVTKRNAKQNFRLDVSAYAPMLCLARVTLADGNSPIYLERYIDF